MSGLANGNSPARSTRAPVLTALAAQGVAFVLCFGFAMVARRSGLQVLELPLILAGQGIVAAVLGLKWGLPRWWVPLQLVLPGAAGAALMLELPSWIFLAAFAVLVLVFWNASGERVPLYLTNRKSWAALAQLISTDEAKFVDIGCGVGGTLTSLARAKPDMAVTGIESAPLPFMLAWIRIKMSGLKNIELVYGDFWKLDLKPYDVVYAFLSPAPMPALYEKARAEMAVGSRLISNSFTVPEIPPDETHAVDDSRGTKLLIWRMP